MSGSNEKTTVVAKPRPLILLGLPKSGTTLVQRLLTSHSAIATVDEPWILLPIVYALRSHGMYAEYGARSARLSLEGLIETLPGRHTDFWTGVRAMSDHIQGQLSGPDAVFFLEKTPRYHLIVPELLEIFSDAAFLVILRNPLSVIASLVEHNAGRVSGLIYGQIDVLQGYENLAEALDRLGSSAYRLNYEDLVANPEKELNAIMANLDLALEPDQIADFTGTVFSRGDRNGAKYGAISTDSLQKWKSTLSTPARITVAKSLIARLDVNCLAQLGYDKRQIEQELAGLEKRWNLQGLIEYVDLGFAVFRLWLQRLIMRNPKGNYLY